MALHNTQFDAANTAVRAFLTKIGEEYYGKSFNVSSGFGKQQWLKIKEDIFDNTCAYCGANDGKLQIDHLIMFNKTGFGLHHPGNIVPVCNKCNKRTKKNTGEYNTWDEHLSLICELNNEKDKFLDRWNKIKKHISEGEYSYPKLTDEERNALRIISTNLYKNIVSEFDNAFNLYKDFVGISNK